MDEMKLRALVREEVERTLDEELKIDSHPKFRRLVEQKANRRFENEDDNWDVTYQAWTEVVQESDGKTIERETLDYYAYVAATCLKD
jgi:hypothetical protein